VERHPRRNEKRELRVYRLSSLIFTIFLVMPTGLFALSILGSPSIARGQTVEPVTIPKTDFNGDGYSDLATGEPVEAVGTIGGAGAVNVIYGSSDGLRATALSPGDGRDDQIWNQNSADIEDDAEPNDRFGFSLA
jgi:hypothetical protein